MKPHSPWAEDPTRIDRLRVLWDEGLSTKLIGERLGVGKNSIISKAHQLHLPSRPSPIHTRYPGSSTGRGGNTGWEKNALLLERACQMRNRGCSYDTISEAIGISSNAISRVGRSLGWALYKRPLKKRVYAPRASKPRVFIDYKPRMIVTDVAQCQYILNDAITEEDRTGPTRGHAFCGEPTQKGSPYCPACHSRCYTRRAV